MVTINLKDRATSVSFIDKRLFVVAWLALIMTTPVYSQFVGVWENEQEGITLELNSDNSGSISIGTKFYAFTEAFVLSKPGLLYHLDFKIQRGEVVTPCYALIKLTDLTSIKYISFLDKQLRDESDETTLDSGISLTKK